MSERQRLESIRDDVSGWRRWGPYLSERSWGTVREDYSPDGEAWDFLTHEQARSKAYRWGEDGIAGIADRYQLLAFAFAFWNERDRILKERLFGVSGPQGNHGEDVKEVYYYLDATPTHSYLKYLYKYPHSAYPYEELVEQNQRRAGQGPEYEIWDTEAFADNHYFDIVIEYARASEEDLCVRIEAFNRGPDAAPLHILPHLWFRNLWSWDGAPRPRPEIRLEPQDDCVRLLADDTDLPYPDVIPGQYRLGPRYLIGPPGGTPLFTGNETNLRVVFGEDFQNPEPWVKDAFHRHIVGGEDCVNPEQRGTKSALDYRFDVPPGGSVTLSLRFSDRPLHTSDLDDVERIVADRRQEADEFYESIHPASASEDERRIQRQAFAGLVWTKQSYIFDVSNWLHGDDPDWAPPRSRFHIRNQHWQHLSSLRPLSMPDKWEYPWFAAWDLAFHCVPFALIDGEFAKEQLYAMLFDQFLHPSGQIPAYEWEFSDLNPPVHAWAVWRVYNMDRIRNGTADRDFLEKCFHKLLINFAWWVNRVDQEGNNVFEGGFLGLDNIAVVDRSEPCTDGSRIEQADATGWMGFFCLNLMRIALELAKENSTYEWLAIKFFQHYVHIASAMKHMGERDFQLWDDEDGFFYDVLLAPDGSHRKFRVRSLVGLIPLFAVERLEEDWIAQFPSFRDNVNWFLRNRADITANVVHTVEHGGKKTHVLTVVNQDQLRRILYRLFDSEEFLSDYGIRSLSKAHAEHPFHFDGRSVSYEPAEAVTKIKGGNSNWRGPIWFPTTFLLIESLRKLRKAFGADFPIHTREDGTVTFRQVSSTIANRLVAIFTRDADGRRPVYGGTDLFQNDPHFRDHILFYEYFHGDNGAGLGASHQTGWTALVASLIDEWRD